MSIIKVPLEFVESVADLRLPPKADRRLQHLMDRNTEGRLTESEREEYETLLDIMTVLSNLRVEALRLLGPRPA